jgi:GTPase SAR1 family protein
MTYEEGLEGITALSQWYVDHEADRNEAATRLRLIDTLFFECLGWNKDDVAVEEPHNKEYADYIFRAPRDILIVEAKREGDYFELPAGHTRLEMSLPALMKTYPNVAKALAQVAGYCQKRGVPFGVVSNGHQLIAFIASRSDAIPPLDGKSLVFGSLHEMQLNFLELWDAISKAGIQERKLSRRFAGLPALLPRKLSAVINPYPAVMERNIVQNDLQILSDVVLEDIIPSPELESLFLRECYSQSGALSQFSLASKQILESRYSSIFAENTASPLVTPAVTKSGLSSELLSISLARRPILLLGDVGVGKTTFIRNLISVEAADLFDHGIALHLNLGSQAALATDLRLYVLDEIDKQLRDNYGTDVHQASFVRGTYNLDLKRFSAGIYGDLRTTNPDEYQEKELDELGRLIANKSEHLKRSLEHIVKARRQQVVIFLDNADQRDEPTQESAFLMAQEIAQQWPALVFVSLRPETFNRSQRMGALSGYHAKAFTISPPRIDQVILKRLHFALKITEGKIPVTRLQHIGVKLERLTSIINILLRSLERDARLFECVDNISGGNVRVALGLLTTFIGSGHVDTGKMLDLFVRKGNYQISPHEFIRAVIYGDFRYFDPSRSAITNMFDISSHDGREHFLLPLVIGILDRSSAAVGTDGFVETRYLYESLQQVGFTPDQIDFAVSRAIDNKLLQTSGRQIPRGGDEMPSSMRATSSGLYHAYRLVGNFQYADAMIVDTPILDDTVRESIRPVEDIADRLTRVEIFANYLDKMWSPLAKAACGFDWEEMSETLMQEVQVIRWKQLRRPHRQPR